jgi:hypothetical protein
VAGDASVLWNTGSGQGAGCISDDCRKHKLSASGIVKENATGIRMYDTYSNIQDAFGELFHVG